MTEYPVGSGPATWAHWPRGYVTETTAGITKGAVE
jgi:hypothetical protein